MSKPKNNSGFSLVEALFAMAVLALVIVPALSTFSSHIAAVHRFEEDAANLMHLENLCAEAEIKLLMAPEESARSVVLTGFANLSITDSSKTKIGDCDIHKVTCRVMPRNGVVREAEVRSFAGCLSK